MDRKIKGRQKIEKSRKIISILLITLSVILIGINAYAHSGRTDSSGGHKDNQNKSGLGSYHYHCGGHPTHLHTNGVCPYSSNSSSNTKPTTSTAPATVSVTGIQINENIESLEIGESKILTATITPSNATDKNITWKSSDESIATVTSAGKIIAKSAGIVNITVTSSNGKTSTVKINIKEEPKVQNSIITKTSTSNGNDIMTTNNQEGSNIFGGIVAIGLLGGIGYWGYTQYEKKK